MSVHIYLSRATRTHDLAMGIPPLTDASRLYEDFKREVLLDEKFLALKIY